jgi:hypothetical protein
MGEHKKEPIGSEPRECALSLQTGDEILAVRLASVSWLRAYGV